MDRVAQVCSRCPSRVDRFFQPAGSLTSRKIKVPCPCTSLPFEDLVPLQLIAEVTRERENNVINFVDTLRLIATNIIER